MNKYIEVSQLWKCETCFYYQNGKCSPNVWCESYESYRPAYSALQFADVKPVIHGRWVHEHYEEGYAWVMCSECDTVVHKVLIGKGMNYCPNCGAKMDGGDRNDR